MATALVLTDADSPTLKRSFTFDDDPSNCDNSPSPKKVEFCIPEVQLVAPTPYNPVRRALHSFPDHRRRRSVEKAGRGLTSFRTSMQAQPSPRMFAAPMPFNSVMDNGSQVVAVAAAAGFITGYDSEPQRELPRPASSGDGSYCSVNPPFSSFHQPRNSSSTSASESSDSSPTTTVSTIDSSSITESSPGTSPETPGSSSISSLSGMADASRFRPPERSRTEPFFEMQRPATPAKKARNLKNLAVDTATATYSLNRAVTTAPLAASQMLTAMDKAPAPSPVFVKPPTPPRRKFSNLGLTIVTSPNNNVTRLAVPPTPSMTRPNTLRHFQSSPSLPLVTPSAGPPRGMRLPTIRDRSALEGFADIPLENVDEDHEPNFDVPQSLEEKACSYPNGPIRIYESGIDLYYEPSLEVACKYDVILNVASEVKNPFASSGDMPQNFAAVLPSPTVGVLADPLQDSGSPSTPKATPISTTADTVIEPLPSKKPPEYIHIPWEHNTDIVPDLHRLVKLIDERVSQGKKVLVHCQCGVSRSASLIVAYGLYKNPGTTVQEAYDAVKRRSKWIGPNMNLIMQLQEFRSSLLRSTRREHGYSSQIFTIPRKLSTAVSSASTTDHFTPETESGPVTPRTAPLPPENASQKRPSTGNMGPFSASTVDPGQGSFWEPGFRRSWGSNSTTDLTLQAMSVSDTPYVDTKGHLVPIVTVMEQGQNPISLSPQAHTYGSTQLSLERSKSLKRKTINFSKPLALRQELEDLDSPMQDAGISIFSPRSEEFHMTPVGTDNTLMENHDKSGIFSPFTPIFGHLEKTPEQSPGGLSIHEQILRIPSFPFSHSPPQRFKTPNRSDSLEPTVPVTTPSHKRSVRTKFSSPSLREQIHLQRLQTQIEASLPHSPGSHQSLDDIDALMSPRATEFTINPFHALFSPSPTTPQKQFESTSPVTPASSESDPRSPAQHGISPITRNILDVL